MPIYCTGSQSSYQVHTGLYAQEGFSNSTENMDRALNALEQMVAEFTKPEYNSVVTAIELVNEPWIEAYMPNNMPWELLEEFMVKAYDVVRKTEIVRDGKKEVMVIIHDAFGSLTDWTTNFFGPNGQGHNWVNYALDTHIYQAWSGITSDEGHIESACGMAGYLEETQKSLPVVSVKGCTCTRRARGGRSSVLLQTRSSESSLSARKLSV
jgi:glucan 1,3-beta-glucosidase